MKSILLLRIPPPVSEISDTTLIQWGVFSGHGELQGEVHVSELGNIKKEYLRAIGVQVDLDDTVVEDHLPDQITVLLSGTLALHRQLPINSGQRKHLNTALPYMIEEDFAEDVDTLHLASQLASDKESVAVSGFPHKQFQVLLACMDGQGLSIDNALAEVQMVNTAGGQAFILLENQSVIMQIPSQAAINIDYDALQFVLTQLATESSDGNIIQNPDPEDSPATITSIKLVYPVDDLSLDGERLEQVRAWVDEQGWLIEEQGIDRSVFEHLASLYFAQRKNIRSLVDLRTGAYQCPRRASWRIRKWKPVVMVATLWLMLEMGLMIGEGISFQHRAADFWDQSASLYLEVFPQDQQVNEALNNGQRSINVKSRMESRLKTAGNSQASKPFLPLLQKVSAVSSSLPEAKIQPISMDFNDTTGNLVLELRAESLESVDKLLAATKSAGLMAKLDSANQEKNGVNARMTISR